LQIKVCSKCGKIKLANYDFRCNWHEEVQQYYFRTVCSDCANGAHHEYYHNNKDIHAERAKIYRINHIDQEKQRCKRYSDAHKEEKRLYRESHIEQYKRNYNNHYANNRAYYLAKGSKRRAEKRNQMHKVSDHERKKTELVYKICMYLNDGLPKPAWHVDHIKPLSKQGLHHPDNLWIIPAEDNLHKFNNEDYKLNHNMFFKL
jgi:hypothetical protein